MSSIEKNPYYFLHKKILLGIQFIWDDPNIFLKKGRPGFSRHFKHR